MENLKTRYSLLEEQGVEKLPKIQEKMKRLGTLALGVENPSFPRTRRKYQWVFQQSRGFFNYPENIDDFNYLIESFMQRKAYYVNSQLGEETNLYKLIVMDDVSDLADKSDVFSNFLTVFRKYGMSCVYIFHRIYPSRQHWNMIISQTDIFHFFPVSVHNGTIIRTVYLFANKFKNSYVPTRNMWLSRLYFNISISKQKQ